MAVIIAKKVMWASGNDGCQKKKRKIMPILHVSMAGAFVEDKKDCNENE
jgi:hypothetical protein